jgi:hypothetical protein
MRPHEPIADFGSAVARELSFDPHLARRLRAEVEDHLQEAAAAHAMFGSQDPEREAIRAFGDPREIASQFLAASLLSFARRATAVAAVAVVGAYGAMEARAAWYGWVNWPVGERLRAASDIAHPIDRFAFMLACAFTLAAAAYAIARRAPARFQPSFGRETGHCIKLSAAIALVLVAAITIETILTGIRLAEACPDLDRVVPLASLTLEATVAAASMVGIAIMMRRWSSALRRLAG